MDDTNDILVLTTGGTFDKIYFDARSSFEVGDSMVGELLKRAEVRASYSIRELLRKDSLDLTDDDRAAIRTAIVEATNRRFVITHGTDTMTQTAAAIGDAPGKTVVLTGALAPARFADTDAMFNLGMAFAAAQVLPPGVYIAMNGRIFEASKVVKDTSINAFIDRA